LAYAHTDRNLASGGAYMDTDRNANGNRNADCYADAGADSDKNPDSDKNASAFRHADQDAEGNSNEAPDEYPPRDANAYQDCWADENRYA